MIVQLRGGVEQSGDHSAEGWHHCAGVVWIVRISKPPLRFQSERKQFRTRFVIVELGGYNVMQYTTVRPVIVIIHRPFTGGGIIFCGNANMGGLAKPPLRFFIRIRCVIVHPRVRCVIVQPRVEILYGPC